MWQCLAFSADAWQLVEQSIHPSSHSFMYHQRNHQPIHTPQYWCAKTSAPFMIIHSIHSHIHPSVPQTIPIHPSIYPTIYSINPSEFTVHWRRPLLTKLKRSSAIVIIKKLNGLPQTDTTHATLLVLWSQSSASWLFLTFQLRCSSLCSSSVYIDFSPVLSAA